jgi:pimeloyl-ACP methyl ester carboxylesterase
MGTSASPYRVNGIDLHAVVEGQGPPVLLIHGFPDTSAVWRTQILPLVAAGFRVIVPDLRGFGLSQAPEEVSAYRLDALVADLVGLLDALGIARARVVGHDWGAMIGWSLTMHHPDRVECFVALSVGHPAAYLRAPLTQKRKGWYSLFFQLRGVAEWLLSRNRWRLFTALTNFRSESPGWIAHLSRPRRLTAALNVYRANAGLILRGRWPPMRVPVMGVWSTDDAFLVEAQMTGSSRYVLGPWR